MLGPKGFADVREFEPGVSENALSVTGRDELIEIVLAPGFRSGEMPCRDVQRLYTALAPAPRHVVKIDPLAVRRVEEYVPPVVPEGELQSEIHERVEQVRVVLVAFRARVSGRPEHGAGTLAETGQQWSRGSFLTRENGRLAGDLVDRNVARMLPDNTQAGLAFLHDTRHLNGLTGRLKPESYRGRIVPNQNAESGRSARRFNANGIQQDSPHGRIGDLYRQVRPGAGIRTASPNGGRERQNEQKPPGTRGAALCGRASRYARPHPWLTTSQTSTKARSECRSSSAGTDSPYSPGRHLARR